MTQKLDSFFYWFNLRAQLTIFIYVTNAEVKKIKFILSYFRDSKKLHLLIRNVFKNIIWYLVAELFGSI